MTRYRNIAILVVAACMAFAALGITACGEKASDDPFDFGNQVKEWESGSVARYGTEYWSATACYCTNPTHEGVQSLTIYAPREYLDSKGKKLDTSTSVGGYTAETAPIVYWNSSGSYIGMGAFSINGNSTRSTQYGWVCNLINNGVVVCMVGERGKTTADGNGNVIGRGPVAISDLKAGVRYLKHNDSVLPGDSNRIISVGTSSGGSMSALLGTSGNNPYYDSYLEEMGACMDETDDVYATMAYCPITDLSHADYAYEWMFWQDDEDLDDFSRALSGMFKTEYVSYINGLGLTDEDGNALTLAEDGSKSGSYYDWLVSKYEESYEDYVKNYDTDYKDYVTGKIGNGGADEAEQLEWLDYDAATGKAALVTPEGYDSALDAMILTGYRSRQKSCPSFDSLDPFGTDNDLFGEQGTKANDTATKSARHFNQRITEMIGELKDDFPEEYEAYYDVYYEDSHNEEVMEWNTYLNSYSFLTGEAEGDVSPHFRVNMGSQDADTSIMVAATLYQLLEKNGIDAEFNIMWGWGHNDVDTPEGLLNWINSICK